MKYNKSFSDGNFDDYKKYLNGIKKYMQIELYNFIIESKHHDLGEKSLHDSRIEKIEFNYNFTNNESNIIISLLGEKRHFILHFFKIKRYKIKQILENNGYTDLITYEIYLNNRKEKTFGFRAEFSNSDISIICKEIKIEERLNE